MAEAVDAFVGKEMRGWILRFLFNLLPKAGSTEIICEMLMRAGFDVTALHVLGHFRYLADDTKNYIELEEVQIMGVTRHMARLNSRGVDYIEGNMPEDPGISRK